MFQQAGKRTRRKLSKRKRKKTKKKKISNINQNN